MFLIASGLKIGWFILDWQFWLALALIVAITTMLALVFSFKKEWLRMAVYVSTGLMLAFIITIIIYNLVLKGKDGEYSEMYQLWVGIALVLIVAGIIACAYLAPQKDKTANTVPIVYAAICIALSFSLSFVKFVRLPQGGSITLARLLPLVLYAYMFGIKKGLLCCFVYSMLEAIQDPFIVHPVQFLLDYTFAFTVMGIGGLFRKFHPAIGLPAGILIGSIIRYFCHVISGAVFFAEYAAPGYGAWAWGFLYNLFVFGDAAVAIVVSLALCCSKYLVKRIQSIGKKQTIQAQREKEFAKVN